MYNNVNLSNIQVIETVEENVDESGPSQQVILAPQDQYIIYSSNPIVTGTRFQVQPQNQIQSPPRENFVTGLNYNRQFLLASPPQLAIQPTVIHRSVATQNNQRILLMPNQQLVRVNFEPTVSTSNYQTVNRVGVNLTPIVLRPNLPTTIIRPTRYIQPSSQDPPRLQRNSVVRTVLPQVSTPLRVTRPTAVVSPINQDASSSTLVSTKKMASTPVTTASSNLGTKTISSCLKKIDLLKQPIQKIVGPSTGRTAKMLVVLSSGERRLITFTLPKESCTIEELLQQINISYSGSKDVQLYTRTNDVVDFIVSIGVDIRDSVDEIIAKTVPLKMQQNRKILKLPSKFYDNYHTQCPFCLKFSLDFGHCDKCNKIFHIEPKKMSLLDRPHVKVQKPSTETDQQSVKRLREAISNSEGRTSIYRRIKIEESVITLSSDDEDDTSNNTSNAQSNANTTNMPEPLACEPEIDETDSESTKVTMRIDINDEVMKKKLKHVSVDCQEVWIASYSFEPAAKVIISEKGLYMAAPTMTDNTKLVDLNIEHQEIIKVLLNFNTSRNIVVIYTVPSCTAFIRELLEMNQKFDDNSYNPKHIRHRIILNIPHLSEAARSNILSLYPNTVVENISTEDADSIISSKITTKNTKDESSNDQNRYIFSYPPGKYGIPVNTDDYQCLAGEEYLNDIIMDFYLKHIHYALLSDIDRERTYIFSAHFYTRLTTKSNVTKPSERGLKLTAAQKRHSRVKTWTKNIDIFKKDFVIIPICEQSHWFVVIICFANQNGPLTKDGKLPNRIVIKKPKKKSKDKSTNESFKIGATTISPVRTSLPMQEFYCIRDEDRDEAEEEESDVGSLCSNESSDLAETDKSEVEDPVTQPCILIFDSLLTGSSRGKVSATLRDYLTCEYAAKYPDKPPKIFNASVLPSSTVKVPQQNNLTDCGLYVLQYVEHFFSDPIVDFSLPIKRMNWFESNLIMKKREEIANLIVQLAEKYAPEKLPLPDILFTSPDDSSHSAEKMEHECTPEFEEDETMTKASEEVTEDMAAGTPGTSQENPKIKRKLKIPFGNNLKKRKDRDD